MLRNFKIDIDKITDELFNGDSATVHVLMNFLSDEFSIDTNCNNNLYKICSAVAQTFYSAFDGFLYPSIQRKFEGFNFAINPKAVCKLQLVSAIRDAFKKTSEKGYKQIATRNTLYIEDNKLIWE